MLWENVLCEWENGTILKYPPDITDRFIWNTSVLKNNGRVEYKQLFKILKYLPQIQDTTEFKTYIRKSKNKYVTSFPNLSNDIMLVIPMPVKGKNYVTLKDFIDNSTKVQQKHFWKKVAEVARDFMKEHKKVWISVHGLGVHYTHVRISTKPKYYFNDELKKG